MNSADDLTTFDENPATREDNQNDILSIDLVESVSPQPTDAEFRYLGLTTRQIRLLEGQPDFIRQEVYDEALRLLMERDYGSDSLSDFLAT